ncbi:hypothetical protein [Leyella stercorea]|uniref:hypothetical protein n=1 Tax=Leyella stercorea TaxID=363265 RepID=UPI003AF10FC2
MYYSFNRQNLQEEKIDLESFNYTEISPIPFDESWINCEKADGIYVKVPDIEPLSITIIETGYYNSKTKEKFINRIKYKNVIVSGIYAVISKINNGWDRQYHYRIELSILNNRKENNLYNNSSDNCQELVYGSKDLVETSSSKWHENIHTISDLFNIHIPNICFAFANGITCQNIDFYKYLKEQSATLEDRICNILENIKLSELNEQKYLYIDAKVSDTWIINILSKALEVVPFLNYQQTYYMYEVQSQEEPSDLTSYKKLCIYNLLYNYNISDDILLKFLSYNDIEKFDKSNQYSNCPFSYKQKLDFFFDFIYSVKSEGRVNGYYRVGRDDKEETIERISFELNGFAPSEKFIDEINSVLNIELKKMGNNTLSWSYEEMEAVAGLAKSRDYTLSYQKENVFKLEKFLIGKILKNGIDWLVENYKE